MTSSDCWIEAPEDAKLKKLCASLNLEAGRDAPYGFNHVLSLPSTSSPGSYWISELHVWARQQGLAVEGVHSLRIRVPVSRTQLLTFLGDMFWAEEDVEKKDNWLRRVDRVERLRALIRNHFRDDITYFITADEF